MNDVEFYEEDNSLFMKKNNSNTHKQSSLVKLILRLGLVKTENGANALMVVLAGVFIITAITILLYFYKDTFFPIDPSTMKSAEMPYYKPSVNNQ